jgi:outer membrane protein insertion porin family
MTTAIIKHALLLNSSATAKNWNMRNFYIVILAIICSLTTLTAQDTGVNIIDYSQPKEYEIGGIEIEGSGQRDENAIKSITGLKVGEKIKIPGDAISKAIKSLWRLRLFTNVEVYQEKVIGDVVFLKVVLKDRPILSRYAFRNVKKSRHDDLNDILELTLTKGGIVTENSMSLSRQKITDYFVEKGYLDAEVKVIEEADSLKTNAVRLIFDVDKKERIKIKDISFEGNENLRDKKLRKLMKSTKRKKAFLRKSKFTKTGFDEDKENIITYYNNAGFRDAKIVGDSIWRDENGELRISMTVDEGKQYFFRTIRWKGNSLYTDDQLNAILGILPGDVYNEELLQNRLNFSFDGRDISSLYLDDGYLSYNCEPTEVAIFNDSIDIEMRIFEGPQFTIDNVVIKGNDRTNESVIRRELRTRPGQKFSRSDIIRSQRQIINLGYFNPESLGINTPVNQQRGTVDIEYTVEERPSDQLELSAGYGGFSGLIGTLGVTFNNFSIQNVKNKGTWNPLPQGDGQKLSLRVQSNSRFFKSYNFSFTEPWLGGKKPNAFTVGAAFSAYDNSSFGQGGTLDITRVFAGLGTQLKKPDDFFVSNTVLNFERILLDDFRNQFLVENGNFRNFNIRQTISRNSVNEPIFPRRGSRISLTLQFTPPYSLFRGDDQYWILSDSEKEQAIADENRTRGVRNMLTANEADAFISDLEEGRKFTWLEYHKWRFDGEWYFNLVGNLVMMTSIKFGFLGNYNSDIGTVPFERFEIGGDGLTNQTSGITGTDIISLRGYEDDEFPLNNQGGGTVFDKFTIELRYPLSTNPNSTIYLMSFLQGGNSWSNFRDFNPFDIKRSAGFGLRVFLPMFGLLGFDYGFGLDREKGFIVPVDPKWSDYGKFSIILGFEPE